MKIFYFTSTGNCLYIAKKFKAELYSIPQVLKGTQFEFEDDKIGIIVPCYGFTVPLIVKEFIQKVTLKSNYVFAIVTYGNTPGNCCGFLSNFAAKNGLHIDYANHLLMGDNFLLMFDAKQQREKNVDIDGAADKIMADIQTAKRFVNKSNLFFAILTTLIQGLTAKSTLGTYKKFHVEDGCNGCSTCKSVCPRDNISIENGRPVFHTTCEGCLGCANLCPKKAIKMQREKNPNERFKHPSIGTAEIVKANQ